MQDVTLPRPSAAYTDNDRRESSVQEYLLHRDYPPQVR